MFAESNGYKMELWEATVEKPVILWCYKLNERMAMD
jgi:hypothetical protein